MAGDDDDKKKLEEEQAETETVEDEASEELASKAIEKPEDVVEPVASGLGATRYVHAAFFLAAILGAYVVSKLLTLGWGFLAEWPAAVRSVPQLVAYAEDEREGFTLVAGAIAGTIAVIQVYRREGIRRWADDVAMELSRVTWPTRETVMNGTIVVVLASTIGTVYVAILDRFWSFLTTLVYGA